MIQLEQISKTYHKGSQSIAALQAINLNIAHGEYVAITGSSGSGKSTLLNLLGLLDAPSNGRYLIDGHDASRLADVAASRLRNQLIGFVFQSFHLIPERRAWQNVALPLEYAKPGLSLKTVRSALMKPSNGLVCWNAPSISRANFLADKNSAWRLLEPW